MGYNKYTEHITGELNSNFGCDSLSTLCLWCTQGLTHVYR